MEITQSKRQQHQHRFFDDFGYLFLPNMFADDIDWITREFERILHQNGVTFDSNGRRGCGNIIEQSERLCSLLDHPAFTDMLNAILGDDYNYMGSAGELMVGDGMLHPDGVFPLVRYVKVILYLDHLTPDTGCLRVVPGSHKQGWEGNLDTQKLWGIPPDDVPCVAPDNTPGDVILFNLNTLHLSVSGGNRRRLLVMGFSSHCDTEEEIQDLKQRLTNPLYSDIMINTASPDRMRHLSQPLEIMGQS